MLPLDLHVLSLQLAFILSQDQTLHCNNIYLPNIYKKTSGEKSSVQDAPIIIRVNSITHYIIYYVIDGSFTQEKYISCSCTTCIVYEILSKIDSFWLPDFSFRKADAKIRTLLYIFQIFSKVFFFFISQLSVRKEKQTKKKLNPQPTTPLTNLSKLAALVLESGCKSTAFKHINKINLKLFFEESSKINTNLLIMKYVVEHKNNKKETKDKKSTPYILYIKRKAA